MRRLDRRRRDGLAFGHRGGRGGRPPVVRLDAASIEEIAERVAALVIAQCGSDGGLRQEHTSEPSLVDARTLAGRLGVSRGFVYAHREELGGRPMGDGSRGRLRFDLDAALEGWIHRSTGEESSGPQSLEVAGKTRPQRRRRRPVAARLLPVRGELPTLPEDRE